MYQVVFDEVVIEKVVRKLVDAIDPDRIILFGSRARGDSSPDSDMDILIIKDCDEIPYRRAQRAYRLLSDLGVPKDIIWRTPAEIEEWSSVPNYVTTRALLEGKVLYEKRP